MNVRLTCLLIVVTVSCSTSIPIGSALSTQQVHLLVEDVLRHTPDSSPVRPFDWVLFAPPENDSFPEVSRAITEALGKRYTVYTDADQLPATAKALGDHYVDGFVFTVRVRRVSSSELEVSYSDHRSPLSAKSHTVRYRWNGRGWIATSALPPVISYYGRATDRHNMHTA
jgi:hypothetical protein